MKKHILVIISAILLAVSAWSCEQLILEPEFDNSPQGVFDALWTAFDKHYGGFMVKSVDWDALYAELSPEIEADMSDEALYDICVRLLTPLEDPHVAFVPAGTDLPTFFGGRYGRVDTLSDFDLEVVEENYLPSPEESKNLFLYDILEGEVGYLHIKHFGYGEGVTSKEIAEVLSSLKDTKGMIIDLRGGGGGEDVAGQVIASRFADQRRHYMNTRVKNGPEHGDFTPAEAWHIEPSGDFQYTKPVVILTHVYTLSARETFLLAMKTLPHVTQLGDTTAGGFSNANPGELPNGWGYSISVGEWTAGDGTSYEGIGIAPDILIQNQRSDLLNGKDEVLEKAWEMLR